MNIFEQIETPKEKRYLKNLGKAKEFSQQIESYFNIDNFKIKWDVASSSLISGPLSIDVDSDNIHVFLNLKHGHKIITNLFTKGKSGQPISKGDKVKWNIKRLNQLKGRTNKAFIYPVVNDDLPTQLYIELNNEFKKEKLRFIKNVLKDLGIFPVIHI